MLCGTLAGPFIAAQAICTDECRVPYIQIPIFVGIMPDLVAKAVAVYSLAHLANKEMNLWRCEHITIFCHDFTKSCFLLSRILCLTNCSWLTPILIASFGLVILHWISPASLLLPCTRWIFLLLKPMDRNHPWSRFKVGVSIDLYSS